MKNNYIKSPLNYVGGKHKLLPQILPLFPEQINTFVDLFCGGFNVGINVGANRVIGNDIEPHLINLLNMMKNYNVDDLIKEIDDIVDKYGLSNTSLYGYEYYNTDSSKGVANYNKEKYFKLRKDYNENPSDLLFFVLIIFAFNNQIRFNSKGEFNMPVNKRDFNGNIKKNIRLFVNELNNKECIFFNKNFTEIKIENLTKKDFIYLDPPYLLGCASYNEQDGWNLSLEKDMYCLCDKLNNNCIKFAMSNVIKHKGKINKHLEDWGSNYNIHYLNYNYNNCNYHSLNKESETIEVLITNY